MKCRYCGGEVGLEQKFCPYCGNTNDQAVQHYTDMARFRGRYADTEAEVIKRSERYARIIPRTVLIVFLLIAAAAMYLVSENAYAFPEMMRRRAAERHPAAAVAALDEYLADGDYVSFASYISFNGIRTYNTAFERFRQVYWCSENYKDILLHTEQLFLHTDADYWEKYNASNDIRLLCQSLEYFFETYDRYREDPEAEEYAPYMDDMKNKVLDLLNVYLGIDETEADEFLAMTNNRKAAFIEEALLYAENNR